MVQIRMEKIGESTSSGRVLVSMYWMSAIWAHYLSRKGTEVKALISRG